ncbi:MAG TPA: hypothetical protein VHT05_12135 [Candidatus Elarobacter sp.]|nr:hypothetical protein [Candidatus Elarobacter sp.]
MPGKYLGCEFTNREVAISIVDCFFHNAVPSVAPCRGCKKPICATCRNENGDCPSCVLAARLDAARHAGAINGGVGPSYGKYREPEPPPQPGPAYSAPPPPPPGPPQVQRASAVATVRPETRALVALSYPFWPLALLALLDARGALFVRRQAWQALGFNAGMFGLSAFLSAAVSVPLLGWSVWPLLTFIAPIWVVASVVYGIKVWQGDDVNVPIVSDWVDARLPAQQS